MKKHKRNGVRLPWPRDKVSRRQYIRLGKEKHISHDTITDDDNSPIYNRAAEIDEEDAVVDERDRADERLEEIIIDPVDLELSDRRTTDQQLQMLFDAIDPDSKGYVTKNQVMQQFQRIFSSAKLHTIGFDMDSIATMVFRQAQVPKTGILIMEQFNNVFYPYVTSESHSSTIHQTNFDRSFAVDHQHSIARRLADWFITNQLRLWWLLNYFFINGFVGYLRASSYDIDPALGWGLRIARGAAQIAMLNCLLVLLPVCRSVPATIKRSSLLRKYVPFDDHVAFHKLCGTMLLVAGLIHTGAHISNEICLYLIATPDEISASIFATRGVFNVLPPFSSMLQKLPVWTGLILLVITLIAFPLALIPAFRKDRFHLFWYSHMLFVPFLVVLCFHGALSWLATASSYWWIGPPLVIYMIERRLRFSEVFAVSVRIQKAKELDNAYALFLEKPKRFVYRPGMYLFLNVPTISKLEWHPFTISSAPDDEYISVHVQNAGDWTRALHRTIVDCHANQSPYPTIYLDGPIGSATQDYKRFKTVICIGGGIGATPFVSILKNAVHLWEDHCCKQCNHTHHPQSLGTEKLYFHFVMRGQAALTWFAPTMNQISALDKKIPIEMHQYLSSVKEGANTTKLKMLQRFVHDQTGQDVVSGLKSTHTTHFGRPNWEGIFQDAQVKHAGSTVGVFVCGPQGLAAAVQQMCKKYSSTDSNGVVFKYHVEKFV